MRVGAEVRKLATRPGHSAQFEEVGKVLSALASRLVVGVLVRA